MRRVIAFFRVVPPVPPLMTWTFLVLTLLAAAIVIVDPARTSGMLQAIALLQVFSASSGFAAPARRGYYDLLLTRGERRAIIGLAHWGGSVVAGIASWIAMAGVEAAVTGAARRSFASGTMAAFFLASTVPWATTVALPRFAGAVGWLLVMVLASTIAPRLSEHASSAFWAGAAAILLRPGGIVGMPIEHGGLIAMPSVTGALAAMAVALRWVEKTDIPLEAAQ